MTNNSDQILNSCSNDIVELNISDKNIVGNLNLAKFTSLKILHCKLNKIISLSNLSNFLTTFDWQIP